MIKNNRYLIIIILLSLVSFLPFLGSVNLFDWDEINFAESAREMIVTSDYSKVMINYEPFHEKPPLFIWIQAISMNIFGINEFAARLPNAIIGLISLIFIFFTGKKLKNEQFGFLWAITYFGSILPFFYFKSGIIDPLFNLFIFSSLLKYYDYIKNESQTNIYLITLLLSLAVLTKGPVAIVLFALTSIVFLSLNKNYQKINSLILISLLSIIPYIIWYLIAFGISGQVITKFFHYHIRLLTTGDSGHTGPFYYHFLVVLFGVFPASFLAIPIFKNIDKIERSSIIIFNVILLVIILILFGIVKTKIIHYSSLAYFPVTFLATNYLYKKITLKQKLNRKLEIFLLAGCLFFGLLYILFPLAMLNISSLIHFVKDTFTQEVMMADVNWNGYEKISGYILLTSFIIYQVLKSYSLYRAMIVIFLLVALSTNIFMVLTAPNIAKHTQSAVIEFCKDKSNENAIIQPLSFKSYAHYFYGKVKKENKIPNVSNSELANYLLNNKIDKDVYFIVKSNKYQKYKQYELDSLYSKNGYIFLKKK
jgi:4-amino-4-deoxy-L-arabinose transferase-like glycosyltransferase